MLMICILLCGKNAAPGAMSVGRLAGKIGPGHVGDGRARTNIWIISPSARAISGGVPYQYQ